MSETQKFIFGVVALVVFVFAIFMATVDAHAFTIESSTVVNFDKSTLNRGYSFVTEDQGFIMPIMPRQFVDQITIQVQTLAEGNILPVNKKVISGQYIYDVKKPVLGFFVKPVTIALRYESLSDENKFVYFYDRSQKRWRALPTVIDVDRKLAIAKTVFPYAEVLVAEDVTDLPAVEVKVEESKPQTLEEQLTAQSAIVADKEGNIIFEKNSDAVRSIASLSKLITAEVFLEHNPGWSQRVKIVESDNVGGASINFEPGDLVTVRDLFFATLVGSKNNATRALMRSTGLTEQQFVLEMNNLVKSWGLENTYFVEPTGLSEYNVSTAKEMLEISRRCFNKFDFLVATTSKWYEVKYIRDGEWKNYWVRNTNKKLLDRDLYITGSKTGFTYEAGYNLVTKAKIGKESSKELIALVMGAKISMNYEEVYLLLKKFL